MLLFAVFVVLSKIERGLSWFAASLFSLVIIAGTRLCLSFLLWSLLSLVFVVPIVFIVFIVPVVSIVVS